MIFSAYYYLQDSAKGPIIRSERFHSSKHFEMFPLWYQYLRRTYPNEDIVLIHDGLSAVSIDKALPFITEPYEVTQTNVFRKDVKFHIKNIVSRPEGRIDPINCALFDAVTCAYLNNQDFLWIDNDCLLNTDIYPLLNGAEVFTVDEVGEHLMMGTYFCYISARRLHALDEIVFLPGYLSSVLSLRDSDSRMRLAQEWGFYQLFYFGEIRHSHNLNVTHQPSLPSMLKFLRKNPLPTIEYTRFLEQCLLYELTSLAWPHQIRIDFDDIYHEQKI